MGAINCKMAFSHLLAPVDCFILFYVRFFFNSVKGLFFPWIVKWWSFFCETWTVSCLAFLCWSSLFWVAGHSTPIVNRTRFVQIIFSFWVKLLMAILFFDKRDLDFQPLPLPASLLWWCLKRKISFYWISSPLLSFLFSFCGGFPSFSTEGISMVLKQCEDNFKSAGKWWHHKCKIAGHVLERCARAFSDWNEENDRQGTQEAWNDSLSNSRTPYHRSSKVAEAQLTQPVCKVWKFQFSNSGMNILQTVLLLLLF